MTTYTKVTKATSTAGSGFLSGDGFLAQGFLSDASGIWTDVTKPTDTYNKVTKVTDTYTKITKQEGA
jgi:hypothetical protein